MQQPPPLCSSSTGMGSNEKQIPGVNTLLKYCTRHRSEAVNGSMVVPALAVMARAQPLVNLGSLALARDTLQGITVQRT